MKTPNYILDDFQNADEAERLLLFMTHRDLRSEFMKIVQRSNRQASTHFNKKRAKVIQLSQKVIRKVFPIPAQ